MQKLTFCWLGQVPSHTATGSLMVRWLFCWSVKLNSQPTPYKLRLIFVGYPDMKLDLSPAGQSPKLHIYI